MHWQAAHLGALHTPACKVSTLLANTNGVSHGLLIPADVPSELVLSTRLRLPAAALPPDCSVYTRRFACRQASHPVSNTLLDLVPQHGKGLQDNLIDYLA